jgi:iron complex outermembrane receptor protein
MTIVAKYFVLSLCFLFINIAAKAQMMLSDSVEIDEIEILENRLQTFGFKSFVFSADSFIQNSSQSIDELLKSRGGLYIKSYGFGGIASLAMRGGNAAQTEVLWNGLRINSPMLGQADLALLPLAVANEIRIMPASSSQAESMGGVAGTISLENRPDWHSQHKMRVGFSSGSFADKNFLASLDFKFNNISSATYFSSSQFNKADIANQYRFSRFKKNIVQQNIYFKQKEHFFEINLLHLSNHTILPAAGVDNETTINLLNNMNLNYKWNFSKAVISFQTGIVQNNYQYKNNFAEINSINKSLSWQNKTHLFFSFTDDLQFIAGMAAEYVSVKSNNYSGEQNQLISSIFTGINWQYKSRLKSYILLKESFLFAIKLPFQPSFGIEFRNLDWLNWFTKFSVSRNFRLPTFNDLFWQPLGNPDLLPESGFSTEMAQLFSNNNFHIEITAYLSKIEQQITWIPSDNGLWKPVNYQQINSKGIENEFTYDWSKAKYQFHFSLLYRFSHSLVLENNEIFFQRFIPKHHFSSNADFGIKKSKLSVNYQFSGKRFIYEENYLLPLHYLTAQFVRSVDFQRFNLNFSFGINNILNYKAEQMPGYPLAPRNFSFSVFLSSHDKY